MAEETLAQPYAWDGSWKRGSATDKGSWVYDSATWKQIKELYVWDSGSWKINHPVHGVDCTIQTGTDGTCGAVNASYRIRSTWFGPMPQSTFGTGGRYKVEHYDRTASTLQLLFSASWVLQDTVNLITNFINPNSPTAIFFNFVIGGASNLKFHQAQARLTHTVHGDVSLASGGIVTSSARSFFVDDCDAP